MMVTNEHLNRIWLQIGALSSALMAATDTCTKLLVFYFMAMSMSFSLPCSRLAANYIQLFLILYYKASEKQNKELQAESRAYFPPAQSSNSPM
jgi:hypothetical protein